MWHMFILPLFLSAILFFDTDGSLEKHAAISAYAVNMETGEVLLDKNSDKSLAPASCMKVVTTAAALQLLGPEMRFQTDLEYDGVLGEDGTLCGNLYIRGGGDPCLGSDRIAPALSWEKQVDAWAAEVQKLGVKRILGHVIGDASLWERALAAPGWTWEDLGNYYGAGACALSFHENAYTLFFKPGEKEGDKTAVLRTEPKIPKLVFHNEVKTGPVGSGDQACIYGVEYVPVHFLRGTVPAGVEAFSIRGAIPDPAAFCAASLKEALRTKGIVVEQGALPVQGKREAFYTTLSPPLKDIVYWTNQKSLNLHPEHLLKKMGEGSTRKGTQVVTEFWRAQGIDLEGFNMA
ncbi:MAG TPA: D-alanyl-D-alanine carboxypeptidase/D-alanyl-D-alanine-endopeptidase, partial [Rhabdochlamydiaceae bacterium]